MIISSSGVHLNFVFCSLEPSLPQLSRHKLFVAVCGGGGVGCGIDMTPELGPSHSKVVQPSTSPLLANPAVLLTGE